jgi:septal ring factor EnvC (AmiA/AmiB activator)
LESESSQVTAQLAGEESRAIELQKNRKRTEQECESLRKNITELDVGLRKMEAEKQAKDNQVNLQMGIYMGIFAIQ